MSWMTDVQSKIYTAVKYRTEKKLKEKYPDIYFTQDDTAQLDTRFPTIYVHFLSGRELARDLEGDTVNAYSCDVQVEVTVSKAQGKTVAERVANEVTDQFKTYRFALRGTPTLNPTGNETKQMIIRMNRTIGSSEVI